MYVISKIKKEAFPFTLLFESLSVPYSTQIRICKKIFLQICLNNKHIHIPFICVNKINNNFILVLQ